jgi:hypothetical protein
MGISAKGRGCHFGHDSQNGDIIVLSLGRVKKNPIQDGKIFE